MLETSMSNKEPTQTEVLLKLQKEKGEPNELGLNL